MERTGGERVGLEGIQVYYHISSKSLSFISLYMEKSLGEEKKEYEGK